MFRKKKSVEKEISNVRFINSSISLGGVRLNVCAFEVDGVLIDTGAASLATQFKSFFNKMDVEQVVITHFHEDHTGGAAYLQDTYHLPIFMNGMSIEDGMKKANYPLYRQLFWGRQKPFQAEPIDDVFSSRHATWTVIETPGHAKDHVSFLNNETGQLFSGDLYVHPYTKVVLREENIPQIIASIEKVLDHDFDEMFCCHAGYVKNGRQAFAKKLNYLEELQGEILTLHEKGYSEQEIQKSLFPKKYPITFFSMGEWDSIHMIRSVLHE